MDRSTELETTFKSSGLPLLFSVKRTKYYPDKDYTALRFESNNFRIRALEIWDQNRQDKPYVRIYHAKELAVEIKAGIENLVDKCQVRASSQSYTDYLCSVEIIANALATLLAQDDLRKLAEANPVYSRNSAYDGLELPDVDMSDNSVLGRVFTWKEIIAISEDESQENELRKELSKPGVYLQRSPDGKSRYVGSAYGEGGILGRWICHLKSNGNAKHLNIFVLENGYASVRFTVLEFTNQEDATEKESLWKDTLGSRNEGRYDAFRLNSN